MSNAEAMEATAAGGPPPAFSRLRWAVIGFAFLATVLNYIDRQTLSVLAPTLRQECGITDAQYGLIISAFLGAYTVSNGISGAFVDRVGTKIGYAVFVLWWSVSSMLHAFARGPWSLGTFRLLLGVGEAGNWPAAVKIVSEWFPPQERTLAAGLFNSGAAIGAVVAAPLVAFLALHGGWRSAFVLTGSLGFLWLAGWWRLYRAPEPAAAPARPPPVPIRRLVRTRFVAVFTLSKIFMDPIWYFYIFWIPKYLASVFHFTLADIGRTAWIPFATADAGNLLGGLVTGWMIRHGVPVALARKGSAVMFGLLMTAAIPAIFAGTSAQAIAWISIATLGYTGYTANTLAFPAEVFPPEAVGSIWGLASMGAGFGGMVFASLSGWMIERHGYVPVFIGYGLLPLVGLTLIGVGLGRLDRDPRFGAAAAAR
ncbi:MAG TPA: MFS transporter [Lacunisphaera sp.]|jgi:ACS family hexuronate transporter-like MFS transporter|nr:MFS transporter [Lacunisphaera sp.]